MYPVNNYCIGNTYCDCDVYLDINHTESLKNLPFNRFFKYFQALWIHSLLERCNQRAGSHPKLPLQNV